MGPELAQVALFLDSIVCGAWRRFTAGFSRSGLHSPASSGLRSTLPGAHQLGLGVVPDPLLTKVGRDEEAHHRHKRTASAPLAHCLASRPGQAGGAARAHCPQVNRRYGEMGPLAGRGGCDQIRLSQRRPRETASGLSCQASPTMGSWDEH